MVARDPWQGARQHPDSRAVARLLDLVPIALLASACGNGAAEAPAVDRGPRPVRVLPANSSALELVLPLVGRERIVAVPDQALSWSAIAGEREAWDDVPVMRSFDGETVLSLHPDLIVVHDYQDGAAREIAVRAGIQVLVLTYPTTWEDLIRAVGSVGEALGEPEATEALCARLEERRAALRARARGDVAVLPYANYGSTGWTAGPGTTLDLAIELAGYRNAAAEAELPGHSEISLEQVLSIAPDVFLCSRGVRGVVAGAEFVRNEAILADLESVQQDRIAVLGADLYSTASHRVLDAAEEIARQVEGLLGDGDE